MPATRVKPANPKLRRGRETSQLYAAWLFAHRATPATDYVGGNNLAFNGSVAWTTGPDGPAVSFPGATGNYLSATVFNPATVGDFSAAAWAYLNNLSAQQCVLGFNGTAVFRIVPTSGILATSTGGAFNSSGAVTAGVWHHLAYTLQGTAVTLYLDGVAVGTNTAGALPGTTALYVGTSNPTNLPLNGLVGRAGVSLWTRALTAGEVLRLYAQPYRIWTPRSRWAEYGYLATGGGKVPWHLFFNRSA